MIDDRAGGAARRGEDQGVQAREHEGTALRRSGRRRVGYAFDPIREVILLMATDKSRAAQKRFYKMLMAKADRRFDERIAALAQPRRTRW
jgi:hypothetical protein